MMQLIGDDKDWTQNMLKKLTVVPPPLDHHRLRGIAPALS